MAKESTPKTRKEAAAHPPYLHMITEALTTLKERAGSSVPAMAKFLEQKYGGSLPHNFRKILTIQLKRLLKSERLVKVKNSFKLVPVKATKADVKAKAAAATRKKEKGASSKDADKKGKGKKVDNEKEKKNLNKGKSPKVSEAKKVVKKAIKTKRQSLVKSQDGMNKKKGNEKVAAGGGKGKSGTKKVGKSDAPPGKSTKKKADAGNKK